MLDEAQLALQQRREAFESARPLAGTPPSPMPATWTAPGWPQGALAQQYPAVLPTASSMSSSTCSSMQLQRKLARA